MRHVGPSITIAWLANSLFFLSASTMPQAGLKSFCLILCACFTMLYLCLLTFFLSALVWDTRRVACRTNDCCNICAHCQEDTFCKGDCLSAKQREFSGLPKSPTNSNQFQKDKTSFQAIKEGSFTERWLADCYAPCLLSWPGRISVILFYSALIYGSVYGC